MYEPLYRRLPDFERETGLRVEITACLPHPELNLRLAASLPDPAADLDLVSTHTKYAPSQAAHLAPLEDLVDGSEIADLLPRIRQLATIDGKLLQIPRLLDVRVLYVRRDRFDDVAAGAAFEKKYGRPLVPPHTWDELLEVATFLTRPGQHGFLFPGRESGLFGTFYEMLVSAGGDLFASDLQPKFASPEGAWAAGLLATLHQRHVTPTELPDWHYDEVSAAFRAGKAAMACDWPGSDYLYADPGTCVDAGQVGIVSLPAGPTGHRAAYGGCHSFAIPKHARNVAGAQKLLAFLTSEGSRDLETQRGAFPVGRRAIERVSRRVQGDKRASSRWSLLTDLMQNSLIIPPRFAAYPECEEVLWRALQDIITARSNPAEGLRRASDEIALLVAGQTVQPDLARGAAR